MKLIKDIVKNVMKIEVSNGEIVDKHTILSIKTKKIVDAAYLENIFKEFDIITDVMDDIKFEIEDYVKLMHVNTTLWYIEDELRLCEKQQKFDDRFINLARQVYQLNDKRAAIKKRINLSTGSLLIEEKSYK